MKSAVPEKAFMRDAEEMTEDSERVEAERRACDAERILLTSRWSYRTSWT
jgi:hypothetical protein